MFHYTKGWMHDMVISFWKNNSPHKFILLCYIGNLMWHHWLNGNDDHILEAMKSILIGNQLRFQKHISLKILKKGLLKIWLTLGHSKILVIIQPWFLRKGFHTKVYYFMLLHTLNHWRKFGRKFNMNLSIFYHSNQWWWIIENRWHKLGCQDWNI